MPLTVSKPIGDLGGFFCGEEGMGTVYRLSELVGGRRVLVDGIGMGNEIGRRRTLFRAKTTCGGFVNGWILEGGWGWDLRLRL